MNSGIDEQIAGSQFKNTCNQAINDAKLVLEKDLGWGDYLNNLLKILTNGIIGVFTTNPNAFFSYAQADSVIAVEEAREDLVTLEFA